MVRSRWPSVPAVNRACGSPGSRAARIPNLAVVRSRWPPVPAARSKYEVAPSASMQSGCCSGVGGRGDHYPRTDLGDSQRSAGSYSQHSSQDGAVLGRFPKPAAPFRTPAGTPLLEPGLVNSLLRQQADRDDAMRRLNERVNSMEGTISALRDANSELMSGQKRRESPLQRAPPEQKARPSRSSPASLPRAQSTRRCTSSRRCSARAPRTKSA